jgi:hypothetical protein
MPFMLAPTLNQSSRQLRKTFTDHAFLPRNSKTSKQIYPDYVA